MATLNDLDPGTLVIEELTGDRRKVRLHDRALPSRQSGMPFEVEQALDTQWVQGSPVATQQPQGGELKPTQVSGTWKDRFIDSDPPMIEVSRGGASTSVTTALELALVMEDICLKGQVVRVSYLSIVRVGALKRFKFDPKTTNDVDWEAEFEWQAKDTTAGRVSSVVSLDNGSRARDVTAAASAVDQAADFSATTEPLDPDAVDSLGDRVTALLGQAAAAEDAALGSADGILAPANSALATANAFGVVVDGAQACVDEIEGRVDRTWLLASNFDALALVPGGQVLAMSAALWDTVYAARQTQRSAARHRYQLSQQTQADTRLVTRARQGDDLRSVAQRFGFSADDWQTIADYNDLPGSGLTPGQKVAIPNGRAVKR